MISRIFAFHFFYACVVAPRYPSVPLRKNIYRLLLEHVWDAQFEQVAVSLGLRLVHRLELKLLTSENH